MSMYEDIFGLAEEELGSTSGKKKVWSWVAQVLEKRLWCNELESSSF